MARNPWSVSAKEDTPIPRFAEKDRRLLPIPIKFENIVRQTPDQPLTGNVFQSPEQELTETSGMFHLTKYRLDDCLASAIEPLPTLGTQPSAHAFPGGQPLGWAPPNGGRRSPCLTLPVAT